jgi:hypothetical protein
LFSFAEVFSGPIAAIRAKKIGDDVHISWRLYEKAKPHDFIVQRSMDKQNFQAISIITNTDARATSSSFGYIDENVVAFDTDIIYYRVIAIDAEGENFPSEVASVSQKESKGLIIDYYKLPEEPEKLFVAYRAEGVGDLYLQIFGPSGKSIFYKRIQRSPGFQVVEVPVHPDSKGTFRIQLFDDKYAVEKKAQL